MRASLFLIRVLPIVFTAIAAMVYVAWVEGTNAYLWRNLLPILMFVLLAAFILVRGDGRWNGKGWSWPLGALGFAIPSIGLSVYLHYGYQTDMDGMFSESIYPLEVFRLLPVYTMLAGGIGFAIGWIAGRNVR